MCLVSTEPSPLFTKLGTPLAQSWTDEWVARVEAREEELGRRICGARTIGHAPCPAGSTHPSGRCVHHGGFDLTGAPEGNRNAAVHFLYARRVMPCGEHCPAWRSCPLGGGGADHGKSINTRAYADRPACPFEQAEYNAVVTDALKRTQFNHENSWGLHLAHQLALMTIMVSRSARFLATHPFTDNVEVYQGEHHTITTKPAAALIAYDKLTRELRRWTLLLERGYQWVTCDQTTATRHKHRQTTDINPDPDSLTATAEGSAKYVGAGPRARPPHADQHHRAATVGRPYNENAAGQPHSQHRDTEQHREGQDQNGQDEQNSQDANALDLDPNLRPPAGNAFDLALPDPLNPSNPWPNPSSVGFLAGTAARIHKLIATHTPELLQPSKISDPPNGNLRNIFNPGQGP